jgi:hypothetical protein
MVPVRAAAGKVRRGASSVRLFLAAVKFAACRVVVERGEIGCDDVSAQFSSRETRVREEASERCAE